MKNRLIWNFIAALLIALVIGFFILPRKSGSSDGTRIEVKN